MQILVNQEPVEYTLEDESSLGDVVDGLAVWLRSGRFTITALDVNDTSYPIHDRSLWQDMELQEVDRLAIEALPFSLAEEAALVALDEYCNLLSHAVKLRDETAFADVAAELPYVRKRLSSLFPMLADGQGNATVLAGFGLGEARLPDAGETDALLASVDGLRTIIASRLREHLDPAREIAMALGRLHGIAADLVDVPVKLQTNEEPHAMQSVVTFTELLGRVLRLLPLVEHDPHGLDTRAIRSFAEAVTPHLAALQDAFEAHDTVMIGDLFEYEVAPLLGTLSGVVSEAG